MTQIVKVSMLRLTVHVLHVEEFHELLCDHSLTNCHQKVKMRLKPSFNFAIHIGALQQSLEVCQSWRSIACLV